MCNSFQLLEVRILDEIGKTTDLRLPLLVNVMKILIILSSRYTGIYFKWFLLTKELCGRYGVSFVTLFLRISGSFVY